MREKKHIFRAQETWFQHLEPLALSEALEELLQALWNGSRQPSAVVANGVVCSAEVPRSPAVSSPSLGALPDSFVCQPVTVPSFPSSPLDAGETGDPGSFPLEEAMASSLQEQRESKRLPKTLEWHQTSLLDLQRFLWRHRALPLVRDLN